MTNQLEIASQRMRARLLHTRELALFTGAGSLPSLRKDHQ
jgi:hypothetical protein